MPYKSQNNTFPPQFSPLLAKHLLGLEPPIPTIYTVLLNQEPPTAAHGSGSCAVNWYCCEVPGPGTVVHRDLCCTAGAGTPQLHDILRLKLWGLGSGPSSGKEHL